MNPEKSIDEAIASLVQKQEDIANEEQARLKRADEEAAQYEENLAITGAKWDKTLTAIQTGQQSVNDKLSATPLNVAIVLGRSGINISAPRLVPHTLSLKTDAKTAVTPILVQFFPHTSGVVEVAYEEGIGHSRLHTETKQMPLTDQDVATILQKMMNYAITQS